MPRLHPCFAVLLALTSLALPRAGAQVQSVSRTTLNPERYGRVDFVVVLKAEWTDPYASRDVALDLSLVSPSGRPVVVPAYFEKGESGAPSEWRIRFAPVESGAYQGSVILAVKGSPGTPVPVAFTVAPSKARGFLRPAGPWIFRFDSGEPFRGIGENLCWESRSNDDSKFFKALHEDPRFNYTYLLGELSKDGGTFFRTWMCPWNLPLEWHHVIDTARYADDTRRFNLSAIRRMDELLEIAEATNTYFMLTIDPHGAFLGKGWELNSYNTVNGGPAATPKDFFTSPEARARYKDKLRYMVARWGYSPHLAVWEFFNEIDNAMYGQKEKIPDPVIADWHAEMAAFLKAADPYGRLVTTSVSHRDVAGMNAIPSMDFSQKHIYRNTLSIPAVIRQYVAREGKPYVIGEFGREWDWSKDFNAIAGEMDHDYKLGLWLGLFSPTPILPMSWWWEFFDQRHLTPYLKRVSMLSGRMLAAGSGEMKEIPAGWTGPAIPAYAVDCGGSVFALLVNEGTVPVTGSLALPQPLAGLREVQVFDPETDCFMAGSVVQGSVNLTVKPGSTLIVEADRKP